MVGWRRVVVASLAASLELASLPVQADFFYQVKKLAAKAGLMDIRYTEFKKLVDKGKIEQAVQYRSDHLDYFNGLAPDDKALAYSYFEAQLVEQLRDLSDAGHLESAHALYLSVSRREPVRCHPERQQVCERLFRQMAAQVGEAFGASLQACRTLAAQVGDPDVWAPIKACLQNLNQQLDAAADKAQPASVQAFVPYWKGDLAALTDFLQAGAAQGWVSYGLDREPPAHELYPGSFEPGPVLAQVPDVAFTTLPLARFREAYAKTKFRMDESRKQRLAQAYFQRLIAEEQLGYYGLQAQVRAAIAVGWSVPDEVGRRIHHHVTSLDRLVQFDRQCDGRTRCEDLGADTKVDELIARVDGKAAQLLVITSSLEESTELREKVGQRVRSESSAGTRQVRNPDHDRALQRVERARQLVRDSQGYQAKDRGNDGTFSMLVALQSVATDNELVEAEAELARTPSMQMQEVRDPYDFDVVNRTMVWRKPVRYLVIDLRTHKRCEGERVLSYSRAWNVALGLRSNDIHFQRPADKGWVNEVGYVHASTQPLLASRQKMLEEVVQACADTLR